jgi:transcriptional regulator of nitric oxide reductase
MTLRFVIIFLFISTVSFSQHGRRHAIPILHEVSNKVIVQSVYPDADKVEKVNDFWYHVLDEKNKVIGFTMISQQFCTEIIGYNGNTPVMIITDTKYIIKKVSLLSHHETLSYVRLLENKGFFEQWNNKNLKEAKNTSLDAYSGATDTALAIEKNFRFLLENGMKKMPKK